MQNPMRNLLSQINMVRAKSNKLGFEVLESRQLLTGIEISEFMARNDGTLLDGNGESSDWIEVSNASETSVDLEGYYLSDDKDDLTK